MNERIEKLAEQCWIHTDEPLFAAKSPHWEFDRHKFAELIVRECLEIVNRKEYSYHEADPLWETAELIKEHFGVN